MTGAPWQYQDVTRAPAQPNQAPRQSDNPQLPDPGSASTPDGTGASWRGPSSDKKSDAIWNRIRRRFFTQAGNDVGVAVTLAATTKSITLPREEQDALYGVNVAPNWLTTYKVTAKTTTSFLVTFGTAAPASATFDYITFRTEGT